MILVNKKMDCIISAQWSNYPEGKNLGRHSTKELKNNPAHENAQIRISLKA
jgi:hypothetical protein